MQQPRAVQVPHTDRRRPQPQGRLPHQHIQTQQHHSPHLAKREQRICCDELALPVLANRVRADLRQQHPDAEGVPRVAAAVLIADVDVADLQLQVSNDGVHQGPEAAHTASCAPTCRGTAAVLSRQVLHIQRDRRGGRGSEVCGGKHGWWVVGSPLRCAGV